MKLLIPCALLTTLAACTDATEVPDDAEFTETVVVRRADGTMQQHVRTITAGEERDQNQLRAEGPPDAVALTGRDSTCPYYALWIYDRPDLTGNRLCLVRDSGYPVAFNLRDYTRTWVYFFGLRFPDATWEVEEGSIWPGDDDGGIVATAAPVARPVLWFDAWGPPAAFEWAPDVATVAGLF